MTTERSSTQFLEYRPRFVVQCLGASHRGLGNVHDTRDIALYYDVLDLWTRWNAGFRSFSGHEAQAIHRWLVNPVSGEFSPRTIHQLMLALDFARHPVTDALDAGCGYGGSMFAFHAALGAAPPSGVLGSFSVSLSHAPWAAGGGDAYEDWYLVQDFSALGLLNEAAVTASRAARRLQRSGLKFLDRHHAHGDRIAQAALGEFDYFFGDELGYRVGAVGQAKRAASVKKCHTHRFDQFRIEGLSA